MRCGDTAAVCGVRGETLRAGDVADPTTARPAADGGGGGEGDEMARLNLLVPNLELATGCSPAHLPGGPPSVLAQTLTQRIATLLHTSRMIAMELLRIRCPPPDETADDPSGVEEAAGEEEQRARAEVQAFWVLYIDVLFISLDGNAFDAAWMAILAALKDTVLPRAWWDVDREMVLCSDRVAEAKGLGIREVPVPLSFGVFEGDDGAGMAGGKGKGKWVLVDMDGFEEGLCREGGTVVVGKGGRVVRIEKSGGVGVGVVEMRMLVELAGKRREEWMGLLKMS